MELATTSVDRYTIIKASGKIDWENARTLDNTVQQTIEEGAKYLVFNLDDVTFLCSGGIGALVYNLNRVKENGGAIYIISSNEYVNYIFETLKFNIVFDGLLFTSYEEFQERVMGDMQQATEAS